jgi:hypothetical protein
MARKDTQCGVLKSGYAEGSCYRVHFGSDGQLELLDEVRSPWLSWARTLVRHHILIVAAIFVHGVYVGLIPPPTVSGESRQLAVTGCCVRSSADVITDRTATVLLGSGRRAASARYRVMAA